MYTIPSNLGSSHRVPGVLPYVTFIRDSVFLKFDSRGYSRVGDQWIVATHALRIFLRLLEQYQVTAEDFTDTFIEVQGKPTLASKSPGFELMRNILSGSPLLQKLLWILAYGVCLYLYFIINSLIAAEASEYSNTRRTRCI
jgi:nuclear pore complex protein Nup205